MSEEAKKSNGIGYVIAQVGALQSEVASVNRKIDQQGKQLVNIDKKLTAHLEVHKVMNGYGKHVQDQAEQANSFKQNIEFFFSTFGKVIALVGTLAGIVYAVFRMVGG